MSVNYTLLGLCVNAVLAVATLVIAIFAVVQARAAKDNASAAKLNAEILMESQRARIAADVHGNVGRTILDRANPRVEIEIFNRGASSAYDFTYESWIEILPFPFEDFTPSADHFRSPERMVLAPGHGPLVLNVPLRAGLTEQQRADLKQFRKFACVRIYVKYKDAFGSDRYANFGFYVKAEGLAFLSKYNDAN